MTATEMRTWFDILQDKSGEPWFDDSEKDEFLFDALWDYINEYIGDKDSPSVLEATKASADAISTLLETQSVTSTAAGILDTTQLAAAFTGTVFYPVRISLAGVPVRFARHNDIDVFVQNTYKAPTDAQPYYTINDGGWQVYATTPESVAYSVTALIEPTAIDDLPVRIHRKQVAKAMQKTGLVTEAQALTMMDGVTAG